MHTRKTAKVCNSCINSFLEFSVIFTGCKTVLILVRYIGAVFVGGVFVVLVLVLSALEQLIINILKQITNKFLN